jgi:hypothetical protein
MTASPSTPQPVERSVDTPYRLLSSGRPSRCVGVARMRRALSCCEPWFSITGADCLIVRPGRAGHDTSGVRLPVGDAARGEIV